MLHSTELPCPGKGVRGELGELMWDMVRCVWLGDMVRCKWMVVRCQWMVVRYGCLSEMIWLG